MSRRTGLAALPELLVDSLVGDLTSLAFDGLEVLVLIALSEPVRADIEGRFGGTEVPPLPNVVRLALSAPTSGLVVRGASVPVVGTLEGRLFSSPACDATVSTLLPAAFRADAVTGRVGGLLMVLPVVREAKVLGLLLAIDAVGVWTLLLSLDEVEGAFLVLSVEGGFPACLVDDSAPVFPSIVGRFYASASNHNTHRIA